jgi:predicted nucleic acid-binding protein
MRFTDIPAGLAVFVDANILIYHFTAHPALGPACTALLERSERQEISAFTSAHVLGEMAHRLMTVEACSLFSWPVQGIAVRMRNHPAEVQQLSRHRRAIDDLSLFRVQLLPVEPRQVSLAADLTRQAGLLLNDALIVTVMQAHGLTALASNDADFDRVPGITRYAPL